MIQEGGEGDSAKKGAGSWQEAVGFLELFPSSAAMGPLSCGPLCHVAAPSQPPRRDLPLHGGVPRAPLPSPLWSVGSFLLGKLNIRPVNPMVCSSLCLLESQTSDT